MKSSQGNKLTLSPFANWLYQDPGLSFGQEFIFIYGRILDELNRIRKFKSIQILTVDVLWMFKHVKVNDCKFLHSPLLCWDTSTSLHRQWSYSKLWKSPGRSLDLDQSSTRLNKTIIMIWMQNASPLAIECVYHLITMMSYRLSDLVGWGGGPGRCGPGFPAFPAGSACSRSPGAGSWVSRRSPPSLHCRSGTLCPWRRQPQCQPQTASYWRRWSAWTSWGSEWAAAGWHHQGDPKAEEEFSCISRTQELWDVLISFNLCLKWLHVFCIKLFPCQMILVQYLAFYTVDNTLTGGPGGPCTPFSPLVPAPPCTTEIRHTRWFYCEVWYDVRQKCVYV